MKIRFPIIIEFNWTTILFYSFFLAYGYFGSLTPPADFFSSHLYISMFTLLFFLSIMLLIGFLQKNYSDYFHDKITIHKKDLLVLLPIAVLLFIFNFNHFFYSLYCDELSYATTSQIHATKIAIYMSKKLQLPDKWIFKYVLQTVSLIIVSLLTILFYLGRKTSHSTKMFLFLLAFFLCRLIITLLGGNASPHPSLQMIPPFLISSLLGISDFSFRLSYFISYLVFIFASYKIAQKKWDHFTSVLFVIAIGTIPLLWHLSTTVEHSFWAAILFIYIVLNILLVDQINYVRLISIISIATMMRQPSFIALIPIGIVYLHSMYYNKNKTNVVKNTLITFSPILLFLPFLAKSLLLGTPTTQAIGNNNMLLRVYSAFESHIIFNSIQNSISYWWTVLIILIFIPFSKSNRLKQSMLILFFLITILIYYSIQPDVWGYSKYQAEYAIPFAIAGLVLLIQQLNRNKKRMIFINAYLVLVIAANIHEFIKIPEGNQAVDELIETMPTEAKKNNGGYHLLATFPYNYKEAYKKIIRLQKDEGTFSIGATYGILHEIMYGYTIKASILASEIYSTQKSLFINSKDQKWSANMIDSNNQLKTVLIGALSKKEKNGLINDLKAKKWIELDQFINTKFGSTIIVLTR